MIIEQRIREWMQENMSGYCEACSDTCCNGEKHRIPVDYHSLSVFKEKGVPVIQTKQLDRYFLKNWQEISGISLFLRNGSEVPKPSVIQVPGKWDGYEYKLYADFCPFFTQERKCEIHEDPRRSGVCGEYPINSLGWNDSNGKFDIIIKESCGQRKNLISALTKRFPFIEIMD